MIFAVHKATRRTHSPTINDWKLAKKITRDLKDINSEMRIKSKNPKGVSIASWSDFDFAADKKDGKSVTAGVITADGAAVLRVCNKQTGVSLSPWRPSSRQPLTWDANFWE